jgi:putative ABC transport system permease protein
VLSEAWSELRCRLRAVFRRRLLERDLDDELRDHLEREAEKYRREGLPEAEARRRARLAFGAVEATKDAARDARGIVPLEEIARDLRYALRGLRARPGFAAAVVLTLALGIGGTTAVFSAVDAVLLRPLPFPAADRLVRIYAASAKNRDAEWFATPVHFLAYRGAAPALEAVAALDTYHQTGADIGTGSDVRRIRTLQVSADYFDVLRARPALGRAFQRDEEHGPPVDGGIGAPVVLLSDRLWRERFRSDPAVVGRTLSMSGEPFTVVGVMPPGFADPIAGADVDAWVPLDLTSGLDMGNISNHWLTLIGRLRPGATPAGAQAELDVATERLTAPYPGSRDNRTHVVPLKADVVGSAGRALELMLGAVGLVLLLVCVNVAGLQLVRASERAGEFAVRTALGAGRRRVVRQLLTESFLLAAIGAAAGIAVARLAMTALVGLGASSIPRLAGLGLDLPVLGFAVAVAAASAVAFGLLPAWRAARTEPADVLRGTGRAVGGDRPSGRLRGALVVAQVALAFVLLAGAAILLASFRNVATTPLGIHSDGVLTFSLHLPDVRYDSIARARFYETFNARVEAIPGVKAAGGVSYLPATGSYHNWGSRALTGPLAGADKPVTWADAENRVITPGYFRAAGIAVLDGRAFDARDAMGAADRVIISERLATMLFPGVDPLGQRILTGGRTGTVIGVVPDVAVNVEGRLAPYVYHAHAQFAGNRNWPLFEVVATRGDPVAFEPAVRAALHAMDPRLVMDHPAPLADVIGRGTAQRKFTVVLLVTFAATALVLAALGVFGVLSYVVRLRATEFGIRIALGASPTNVMAVVLRHGVAVIAAGIGLGLLGAIGLSRLLASMVFQVSPLDARALLGAALALAVFGGAAALVPAWRAAAADPRRALE